jgi:hypothetical protein
MANKEEESTETDTQQKASKQKFNPSKWKKDVTKHLRNCEQANISSSKSKRHQKTAATLSIKM